MTGPGHGLDALLREMEASGHRNDAAEADRSRRMLNLERDTAQLLFILVRASRRTRVLEIGTSNGFSTLWLAAALDGLAEACLVSIERDEAKYRAAVHNVELSGFKGCVTLRLGDATAVVRELEGPFDCVFFDADRVSAPDQLALLLPKLTPDCLLLADNALSHPDELAGYRAAVEAQPDVTSMVVPTGKGLHVAYRRAPPLPRGADGLTTRPG